MTSHYHGNLHDITDSIATIQDILTEMQNTSANTGDTSANTSSVATNTSSAGAGLNTDNINNKLLTAQKTSQTMGFMGASRLASQFSTSSTTYVDTGMTISNVPNGAKIIYNIWASCQGSSNGHALLQIIAGATVLTSWSKGNNSTGFKQQDYSGALINTSGSTATVKVQAKGDVAYATVYSGGNNNISTMCAFSSTAIILGPLGAIVTGSLILGSCQISSLEYSILSSVNYLQTQLGGAGISTTAMFASITLPNKQAFANGLPIIVNGAWIDADLCIVVDYSGDLLTVN